MPRVAKAAQSWKNTKEDDTLLNPISQWEEHVEVPGLTLWQLHRPVWTIISDKDNVLKSSYDKTIKGHAHDANSSAIKINIRSFSEFRVSRYKMEASFREL